MGAGAGLRAQGPAGASGAAGSCHWFREREAAEPPVTGTGVRLLHSCRTSDCHQRPGREEGSTVRTPPSPHVRVCVPRAGELGTDAPALLASESAGKPTPCPEGAAGCSLPACPRAASWRPRQCAGQVLAALELQLQDVTPGPGDTLTPCRKQPSLSAARPPPLRDRSALRPGLARAPPRWRSCFMSPLTPAPACPVPSPDHADLRPARGHGSQALPAGPPPAPPGKTRPSRAHSGHPAPGPADVAGSGHGPCPFAVPTIHGHAPGSRAAALGPVAATAAADAAPAAPWPRR